jgi:predicted alpha/beta-fold hydrolase
MGTNGNDPNMQPPDRRSADALNTPYRPPFWARGGLWQTLLGAFVRRGPRLLFKEEVLELPDGDATRLCYLASGRAERLAVLVPGLEGHAYLPYIRHMARMLQRLGFDSWVLDHRGCAMPNRLFESYHSGHTQDIHFLLESPRARAYARRVLVGFSLGGNQALKYLGEMGRDAAVEAAVAVAPPFDLSLSSRRLSDRYGGLMGRYFLESLRRRVGAKARRWPERLPPEKLRACRSVRDFDDLYTAVAHGYDSAEAYYRHCSSRQFLEGIERPTLIVHAMNDPINPLPAEVEQRLEALPWLVAALTPEGGHMGFPEHPLRGPLWHERLVGHWLQAQG